VLDWVLKLIDVGRIPPRLVLESAFPETDLDLVSSEVNSRSVEGASGEVSSFVSSGGCARKP
jgi:hypothetical protein